MCMLSISHLKQQIYRYSRTKTRIDTNILYVRCVCVCLAIVILVIVLCTHQNSKPNKSNRCVLSQANRQYILFRGSIAYMRVALSIYPSLSVCFVRITKRLAAIHFQLNVSIKSRKKSAASCLGY